MKKKMLSVVGAAAFTALLMIPAVAANQNAANDTHNTTARVTNVIPDAWPPESLAGTIVRVVPDERIVIVKDASGVPFDMVVNRSTRIKSGDREVTLKDMASDVNKNASIRFIPERKGDIARSIKING